MLLKQFLIFFIFLTSSIIAEPHYPGTTTVFIPYSNSKKNPNLEISPKINIGFNGNGNYTSFVMDTGSIGIIASSDIFTPAPNAKNLGPGSQFYSSSGIIEEGTWWSATQEIYDENGSLIATADVPVLQVTSVRCSKNARRCTPKRNPKGIAMMGIGFSRKSEIDPRGTPDYNIFLNLRTISQNGNLINIPSNYCNGYIVTPAGIYLGLTSENTKNAGFVKLLPKALRFSTKHKEWQAAPMTLKINGIEGDGNVLMDTGVDTAYLTPPINAKMPKLIPCKRGSKAECLPDGNKIEVYLPNAINPVAYYSFIVGESNNFMQPRGVHIVRKHSTVFFNTSRHILAGMNYIYDNTNGYVGYIWNGVSRPNIGFVKPAVN